LYPGERFCKLVLNIFLFDAAGLLAKETSWMAQKPDPKTVLRAMASYPAVLVPNYFGGFDVFFPNFPGTATTGVNLNLAKAAAREELTVRLYHALRDGEAVPAPSDPDNLLVDEEEISGTRVIMVEPDQDWIMRQLGLSKKRWRISPAGVRYQP